MVRNPYLPPPPPGELSRLQLHELARDFPELLEVFHAWGVDWRRHGTATLEGLLRGDRSRWEVLRKELAWRHGSGADDLPPTGREEGGGARSEAWPRGGEG